MARTRKKSQTLTDASAYIHSEVTVASRPEVGTQAHFPESKKKSPREYRYDSSLAPSLEWDENPAREQAEALIAQILESGSLEEVKAAAKQLKALSQPFLNWTGKAERQEFKVPTMPLFIHERLSTQAIIETLKGHKKGGDQLSLDLFGDPQHSVTDQVLKAYEYQDEWVNRMILGDSLSVMNSLIEYEGLGGQVKMIYMDPPYGVKFGSNFQPFVRNRDVKHNEDEYMTREPEMVKAYRDTWSLGLHSYLSYLRDRFAVARELLSASGSIFVQISDENLHHVRKLMDEVFGEDNFVNSIAFTKTTGLDSKKRLSSRLDYLLWYAKESSCLDYHQLFEKNQDPIDSGYTLLELKNGERRSLTKEEKTKIFPIPEGSKLFMSDNLTKPGPGARYEVNYDGRVFTPGNRWWGTPKESMEKLIEKNRVFASAKTLRYIRYFDDFPFTSLGNLWDGIGGAHNPLYVVQTNSEVIQRCILMTTAPGDLVLDPTCGSGTTAYVAEQWGRRWITCDVSRVPLALARQRLLTATFPYYELKDDDRGPGGGFVYKRKQNKKGEEIGGIVPHITLKSLANNEPPDEEILVDRPEIVKKITRVTGAFTVEATMPVATDMEAQEEYAATQVMQDDNRTFDDRMLEVLRHTPVLRLDGNRTVEFQNIRKPAKSLLLNAEAFVKTRPTINSSNGKAKTNGKLNGKAKSELNGLSQTHSEDLQPVAFLFGPENGAITENTVLAAAKEAYGKDFSHLYVIGFGIHPNARQLIDHCEEVTRIPATYIQATPDLLMGDLLKNMKSSHLFSICGLPDVSVQMVDGKYRVALLGLDSFDPVTMETDHRSANDVPAWLLDTDYNGRCFHVCQAFFPRTAAWDNLKKALKGNFDDSVWAHLAGSLSAPFEAGEHRQIAVKVIDDRGNELLVVKDLK